MGKLSESELAFEPELVALIPQLRAFGRSLCGGAAQGDDLAQDTLAKALTARAAMAAIFQRIDGYQQAHVA